MHDLDGTVRELEWESNGYEADEYETEYEYEYEDEYEDEYESEYEYEDEYGHEGLLSNAEEMEMAAELLEITSEEELEQFIGSIFKKIKRKVRKYVPKSIRKAVSRKLRGLAKKALPWAGRMAGGFIGGPVGAALGGKAASMAGRYFGLELEGLSPEDQEFEVARRFVRLTAEAARQASKAPTKAPPQMVATKAVNRAIKKHAPGLTNRSGRGRGQHGTWKRRGNKIVIFGA